MIFMAGSGGRPKHQKKMSFLAGYNSQTIYSKEVRRWISLPGVRQRKFLRRFIIFSRMIRYTSLTASF
jgi:hypothetical protein